MASTNKITNILLVGVGGQGILLASEVITEAAMRSGFDTKKSEVHGMSQRGGVVSSHIRFGPKVYSALIEEGTAGVIASFEILESLRWLDYLAPGGSVITNTQKIIPPIALSGVVHYPDDPAAELYRRVPKAIFIPAYEIAKELGNERLVNSIILGKLSTTMNFPVETWRSVLAEFVPPKAKDLNLQAFERGRRL